MAVRGKVVAVSNRNAIDFLRGIEPQGQHWLCYEDLVTEPRAALERICDFLSIPFHDAVLHPYEGISPTWEAGDPDLLTHTDIEPGLATAWRKTCPRLPLSDFTRSVAAELGYDLDGRASPGYRPRAD